MSLPKFALIYWTDEECTSVEPTIAVKDVASDNIEDKQVLRDVEWRARRAKAPEGGFPTFKGQLLKASDKKGELQILQKEIANAVCSDKNGIPTKRVHVQSSKNIESKDHGKNKENIEVVQQKVDKAQKKRERDEKKRAKQAQIESAQTTAKQLLKFVSLRGPPVTQTTQHTPEKQSSTAAWERTSTPKTILQNDNVFDNPFQPLISQTKKRLHEPEETNRDAAKLQQNQRNPLMQLKLSREPEVQRRETQGLHQSQHNQSTKLQSSPEVSPQMPLCTELSIWGPPLTQTTQRTSEKQSFTAAWQRTSTPKTILQTADFLDNPFQSLVSQTNKRWNEPEDGIRDDQILHQSQRNLSIKQQLGTEVLPQVQLCSELSPQELCMQQSPFEGHECSLSVSDVLSESHKILYTPGKTMEPSKECPKLQQETEHLLLQLENENQSNSVHKMQSLQEKIQSLQEENAELHKKIALLSSKVKRLEGEKGTQVAGDHGELISLVRQFISDAGGHIDSMTHPDAPVRPEPVIQSAPDSRAPKHDASAIRRQNMVTSESSATVELSSGSGVLLDQVKLEMIRRKSVGNPSKLTRLLMEQFFTDVQMIGSSALGLKSKKGLDTRYLSAIKDYVYKTNPKMRESDFNLFVNRKCADVRKSMRKGASKEN